MEGLLLSDPSLPMPDISDVCISSPLHPYRHVPSLHSNSDAHPFRRQQLRGVQAKGERRRTQPRRWHPEYHLALGFARRAGKELVHVLSLITPHRLWFCKKSLQEEQAWSVGVLLA